MKKKDFSDINTLKKNKGKMSSTKLLWENMKQDKNTKKILKDSWKENKPGEKYRKYLIKLSKTK